MEIEGFRNICDAFLSSMCFSNTKGIIYYKFDQRSLLHIASLLPSEGKNESEEHKTQKLTDITNFKN